VVTSQAEALEYLSRPGRVLYADSVRVGSYYIAGRGCYDKVSRSVGDALVAKGKVVPRMFGAGWVVPEVVK